MQRSSLPQLRAAARESPLSRRKAIFRRRSASSLRLRDRKVQR